MTVPIDEDGGGGGGGPEGRGFRTVKLTDAAADALEAWRDLVMAPGARLPASLARELADAHRAVNGRAKYVVGLSPIVLAALRALAAQHGVVPPAPKPAAP